MKCSDWEESGLGMLSGDDRRGGMCEGMWR